MKSSRDNLAWRGRRCEATNHSRFMAAGWKRLVLRQKRRLAMEAFATECANIAVNNVMDDMRGRIIRECAAVCEVADSPNSYINGSGYDAENCRDRILALLPEGER